MTEEITRQEFLCTIGKKARVPFRIISRLLVIVFIAWVLMLMIELLRGITFYGWILLGGILLAVSLLSLVQRLGSRFYNRASTRSKALCDATREAINIMAIVGISILAWHKIHMHNITSASILIIAVIAAIIQKGQDVYRQKIGEQIHRGDA